MRTTRLILPAILALACAASATQADTPSLDRTDAFERAYATSFYAFDACGDGVAGRIYRQALNAKFAACPFTAAARDKYRQRSTMQRHKASDRMGEIIEEHGGLPVRLENMSQTCREQRSSAPYREVRTRLTDYQAGKSPLDAVVPEPCTADEITP